MITGVSGGGKTAAAKLFEDLDYIVIDNLPGELLPRLRRPHRGGARAVRARRDRARRPRRRRPARVRGDARRARGPGDPAPVIIFLEARDEVLIRRFSETRHKHPLADERGIAASIDLERAMLEPVRAQADVVVDTSDLSLRELRERIFARLGDVRSAEGMAIQLISFGYKYGVPLEADLVFDVAVHEEPALHRGAARPSPACTEPVRDYVLGQPIAASFLARHRASCSTSSSRPTSRRARAAHDRDRLHRRPAPLDRRRGGARAAAAGAGRRPRVGLPPRARAA